MPASSAPVASRTSTTQASTSSSAVRPAGHSHVVGRPLFSGQAVQRQACSACCASCAVPPVHVAPLPTRLPQHLWPTTLSGPAGHCHASLIILSRASTASLAGSAGRPAEHNPEDERLAFGACAVMRKRTMDQGYGS